MVPVLMQTPPHDLASLADPDLAPDLGRLDGGMVAGRAGADDEDVELLHAHTLLDYPRGRNGQPREAIVPRIVVGGGRGTRTPKGYSPGGFQVRCLTS